MQETTMPMNCSAALFDRLVVGSYSSVRDLGWGETYFIKITMMTMTVWFGLSATGI